MKIEIGKIYIDEDGDQIQIFAKTITDKFVGQDLEDDEQVYVYNEDGWNRLCSLKKEFIPRVEFYIETRDIKHFNDVNQGPLIWTEKEIKNRYGKHQNMENYTKVILEIVNED